VVMSCPLLLYNRLKQEKNLLFLNGISRGQADSLAYEAK